MNSQQPKRFQGRVVASVLMLTIASVVGFAVFRWLHTAWPDGPLLEIAAVSEDLVLELREGEAESGFGAHLLLRHRLDGPEWTTKVYGVQEVSQRVLVDGEHIFVRATDAKGHPETHAFTAETGNFAYRTGQVGGPAPSRGDASTPPDSVRAFLGDLLVEVYPEAVIAVRRADGEEVYRHAFAEAAAESALQSSGDGLRLLRQPSGEADSAFVVSETGVEPLAAVAGLWCEGTALRLQTPPARVEGADEGVEAAAAGEVPSTPVTAEDVVLLPGAHVAQGCAGDEETIWALLSRPDGTRVLRAYDRRQALWREAEISLGASSTDDVAMLSRRDGHGAMLLVATGEALWVARAAVADAVRTVAWPASPADVKAPIAAGWSSDALYVHRGETLARLPNDSDDATLATVEGANSERFPLRQVDVRDDAVWTYHDAAARPLDPKTLRPIRALLELPRVDGFASAKVQTLP